MDIVRMKDIEGYEGRYAISEKGDIWCYPHKANRRVPASGLFKKTHIQNRVTGRLKPYLQVKVGLSVNGNNHTYTVSRLVAKAFLPIENAESYMVNHIDGDPTNNAVSNLEWVTAKENAKHAYESGLLTQHTEAQKKARIANGRKTAIRNNRLKRKLSDKQVREIKTLLPNKSMRQIGKQFGVTGHTIANIRDGKTYSTIH